MNDGPYAKQRASRRLRWSLPILLDRDKTIYSARTEDLSAEGARLKAPVAFPPGISLAVTNLNTGERARFEVVWGREARESDNCFRLGIRMETPSNTFWGFQWSSGGKPLGGLKPGESLTTRTLAWRNR